MGLRPTWLCYTVYMGHSDYLLRENVKWGAKAPHLTLLQYFVILSPCSLVLFLFFLCSPVLRFFVFLSTFALVLCFICSLVLLLLLLSCPLIILSPCSLVRVFSCSLVLRRSCPFILSFLVVISTRPLHGAVLGAMLHLHRLHTSLRLLT